MALNKRGFIRIIEVMIAITILSGAILYVYANKAPPQISLEEYVYSYQRQVLLDIANNNTLRSYVLEENETALKENIFLPENLNYTIKICDLKNVPVPCNMPGQLKAKLMNEGINDIYSYDTLIASNITGYNPKKVRIFIWEPMGRD